ncbi:TonB-dependent receptor plug domain-containing protein [Pelagicoccus mobilis]|uniref:TonB-dependent receptor plug domain-containing protein n=1 Tax=Pelagicoccus mobilis TaxID=415221 RepID=A0A934RS08_9BACT|nr:TonB-dependent receptor plug domain-containing protein [Pelagicoccus mobilis]MBK1875807.1 hypothetical protein [Pelagicoccus mobilis]
MERTPTNEAVASAFKRRALAAFAGALLILPLQAQDEDDEVFTLSPFTVTGDEEGGYRSTETMAGTRLRTQIKDTPATLSVLTGDFLDELGATDIASVAEFLPSTETYGIVGVQTAGNEVKAGNSISVRGFRTDTRTRNFFRTETGTDSYLTDRITAARGPNSLLFGIGNPGGSILIGTKRAHFGGNDGKLELRYDSTRDGGHRAVIDQNVVLLEDKLAFRIAAVDEELDGFREPEETSLDGKFATLTWQPFADGNSVVRFNYENEKRHRVIARPWAPYNYFQNWLDQGAPLYDNFNDARPGNRPSTSNPFVRWENRIVNPIDQDNITAYRTARGGGVNGYVLSSGPIVNGVEEKNVSLTEDFVALNPIDLLTDHFANDGDDSTSIDTWLADLGDAAGIPLSFQGEELVIPRETWFSGDLDSYDSSVEAMSAFWEQRFGDNFFIELAGNKENVDTRNLVMLRNNEYAITYDPNLYLPDGSPNPYAGMPFVGGLANPTDQTTNLDSEEYRLTATYKLDFTDKSDKWGGLFGRHQLSALANRYERDYLTVQKRPVVYEWDGRNNHSPGGGRVNHNNAKLGGRYYLQPNKQPYIPEFWTPMRGEGTVGKSDWADLQYFSDNTVIDSYAIGTQSFFFNDRLVLTAGIREDKLDVENGTKVRFTGATADSSIGNHVGELDVPTSRVTLDIPGERSWTNESYGAVYHIINNKKDSAVNTLSVFYNTATNVSADPNRVDIRYLEVSPRNGDGEDYGVKFSLFDNKLSGTFTQFSTTMLNDYRNSALGVFSRSGMGGFGPISEAVDLGRYERAEGSSISWAPIFDQTTDGKEVEFVWNPTKQLRFRGTYSTMESIPSRFGEDIQEYYDEVRPLAVAWLAENGNLSLPEGFDPGNPTAEEQIILDTMDLAERIELGMAELDVQVPLKLAYNGVPVAGLPKERASLATFYSFAKDSKLNGFGVGMTYTYRSGTAVAFETDDNEAANLDNALMADSQSSMGLTVSYRRKLSGDRLDWRLQLNVKNLLDDVDPILLDGVWDRTTEQFLTNRNKMVAPRSYAVTSSLAW